MEWFLRRGSNLVMLGNYISASVIVLSIGECMRLRIQFVIIVLALITALPVFAGDNRCDPRLRARSPTEVLVDHRAALAAQDWPAVRCNYAKRAVVISDQGVDEGREAILVSLQGLVAFFGGVMPLVTEEVAVGSMVRVRFTIDLGFLLIPDGIDTYIIRHGRIVQQTSHGEAILL